MAVVNKGLQKAMASMNLEEVEKIMQKFETQFEDLDVREQVCRRLLASRWFHLMCRIMGLTQIFFADTRKRIKAMSVTAMDFSKI